MFKYKPIVMLLLIALVLVACQAEPEQVEVVVTRVVEQLQEVEVPVEVTRVVEETITEEVEVTRVVEVEAAAPVAGRCAPTDAGEVEEILIGASAPLSKPGSVTGGMVMQAAFKLSAATN